MPVERIERSTYRLAHLESVVPRCIVLRAPLSFCGLAFLALAISVLCQSAVLFYSILSTVSLVFSFVICTGNNLQVVRVVIRPVFIYVICLFSIFKEATDLYR